MSPIFSRHPRGELSAYFDAQLSESRRQSVDAHIATCDSCRAEADELRSMRAALAGLPEVPAPRSFALTTEHLAAPASAPAREYAGTSFAGGLRLASAGIAVALIAVVLVDAGSFSATDDGGDGSGGGDARNTVELQADSNLERPEASFSGGEAQIDASTEANGDTFAEDSDTGDDADTADETAANERAGDAMVRTYEGVFPGAAPPVGYSQPAATPVAMDGTAGGTTGGVGGAGPISTEGAAAPATNPGIDVTPVAAAVPGAEETTAEDGETQEDSAAESGDGAAEPPAAGDDQTDTLGEADSDGRLSTLQIVEIALAFGLAIALLGGFVLPRFMRRAG